jgi:hypothetical protein
MGTRQTSRQEGATVSYRGTGQEKQKAQGKKAAWLPQYQEFRAGEVLVTIYKSHELQAKALAIYIYIFIYIYFIYICMYLTYDQGLAIYFNCDQGLAIYFNCDQGLAIYFTCDQGLARSISMLNMQPGAQSNSEFVGYRLAHLKIIP